MKNFMNSVKIPKVGKTAFDLTHDHKTSFKMGELVPVLAMECYPGDFFKIQCEALTRFAPLIAPIMHKVNQTTHYWFVPSRLMWEHFDEFITHKTAPPAVQPVHPYYTVKADGSNYTRLMDYMGIPAPLDGQTVDENINLLPFYAYQLVWKEFYADQTIQNSESIIPELVDGDNTVGSPGLMELRKRAWPRDYFNSSLPTPQWGVPVDVPIRIEDTPVRRNHSGDVLAAAAWTNDVTFEGSTNVGNVPTEVSDGSIHPDELYVDGADVVSATTVEDIRRASAIQRFFEKLMLGGRRLTEVIRSNFGIAAPDSRLQRPEYITGVKTALTISEVLNTTGDTGAEDPLPQGNMSGHALGIQQGHVGSYKCVEHGWIIGVTSVLPETAYQNGINRAMQHKENGYLDYYWPDFANLGEEAVKYNEIFAYSDQALPWGYLPRYSHLRTQLSRVSGDFRTTLSHWHLGRQFTTAAPPLLDPVFIECTPSDRIFAVQDGTDYIWSHINHMIMAVRPIPKFGTPALI